MIDSVLLLSGGLDSFIGYFYLNKPQPVYFNLKSKYSQKEINHLNKIKDIFDQDIIFNDSLSFLGNFEQGEKAYIPFRNLHLALMSATNYSDHIYICGVKDDRVIDKNKTIFKMWSDTLSETCGRKITIESPFFDMTKVDIIKWMTHNYPDIDLIKYTLSCYDSIEGHCYSCPACLRRNVALYQFGYELPFYNLNLVSDYISNLKNYDKDRVKYMEDYFSYIKKNIN